MTYGIFTALLVITIYLILMYGFHKSGILDRYNLSLVGPLLLWKTTRCKKFLYKLSTKKWVKFYGYFGIILTSTISIFVMLLLLWEATLVSRISPEEAPSPEIIIGIPGVNPLIPVSYGILSLAVAIIIHEFSHGILVKYGNTEIKSIGLVFFVVPIGAFVEPDEEQLKKMRRKKRMMMYGVGPTSNMLIAFLCSVIFSCGFMTTVSPVADGVVVSHVVKDYPADEAGITPWVIITRIEGDNITEPDIHSREDFTKIMASTKANQTVRVYYTDGHNEYSVYITLEDKYEYYSKYAPSYNDESFKGKGFLGVGTFDADSLPSTLAHPLQGSFEQKIGNLFTYIALPFYGLSPMDKPLTDIYKTSLPMDSSVFWILANIFYWLFWLNLMVGATNALPGVPLDGGYIFRDATFILLSKKMNDKKKVEAISLWLPRIIALLILFLILWQIMGPRILASI